MVRKQESGVRGDKRDTKIRGDIRGTKVRRDARGRIEVHGSQWVNHIIGPEKNSQ